MNKILKVILIGAGNRGDTYTDIMDKMTDKFKVVAVAEPIESRRKDIQQRHLLPDNMCFEAVSYTHLDVYKRQLQLHKQLHEIY